MSVEWEDLEDMKTLKPLSSLCLSCIVENFERFMAAYSSGMDSFRKHFEFLQRTYSATLLRNVLDKVDGFEKNETYIEFLLNRHLKEVNLSRYFDDTTAIIKQLIKVGPAITSLKLSYSDYSPQSLIELVSHLRNVETLILNDICVSEGILRSIGSNCHSLKTFNVSSCKDMTDKCIEAFCFPDDDDNANDVTTSSKTLQHFNMDETSITSDGIICALKNLKNLLSLQHQNVLDAIYKLHYDGLKSNCDLKTYNLETLRIKDISHYPVAFIDKCASLFPCVKHLTVLGVKSQQQMNTLLKFPSLKEVYILFDVGSIDLLPFLEVRGKDLEKLHMDGVKVPSVNLLKFCPKLKCLELAYSIFNTVKDCDFSNCTLIYLKNLTLEGFNFEDDNNIKSIKCTLSCCPYLEMLNLCHSTCLTSEFVKSITSLQYINNLTELYLDFTDITLSGAEEFIQKAHNLKKISLQGINCDVRDIATLQLLKPTIDIISNSDISDYSNPDIDDFERDYNYFDYDSDTSYDYYDYGDSVDEDEVDYYNMY